MNTIPLATRAGAAAQTGTGIHVVLISPYELGRQSFGLAHPAACLRADGHRVTCIDLAQERLEADSLEDADLIAVQLAMHTATRIAGEALPRIRALAPRAHLCAYGLYAPVNEAWLREAGISTILGGEFEPALQELASALARGETPAPLLDASIGRVAFRRPDRAGLAPLARHARLRLADGRELTMGFAEASRGCKHLCRHCPVVPVYEGRFSVVPRAVVMDDIRQQVACGAEHISFGDPDFFNGPGHAERLLRAMHAEFPDLTFDAVIKVEHLLAERKRLPMLRECGCRFIISAVESVDDTVLGLLAKGHTRADFFSAAAIMREAGIGFAPTFVAFTPWTTLEGYLDLLRCLVELRLVSAVPAIQLAIRLLVPGGSHLLQLADFQQLVEPFDAATLGHPWQHRDARVDALQRAVQAEAERCDAQGVTRAEAFAGIWALAHQALGLAVPELTPDHAEVPAHHTENWYCCAEPTAQQLQGF